jgi:hypothetical protein
MSGVAPLGQLTASTAAAALTAGSIPLGALTASTSAGIAVTGIEDQAGAPLLDQAGDQLS